MAPRRPPNPYLRAGVAGFAVVAIATAYAITHSSQPEPVACSAPRSSWGQIDDRSDWEIQFNGVMLDHAGQIFWNHHPVSEQALVDLLRTAR
jgi:hypothetical protein